ncbi:TonB-dependent receptor [Stakelama sp. CBK3Z-3]|uniref:TonB-dependent receptor n=1 Tax=Stakelama flava TaxID=2860338 RepID=A0ABS6XP62_9SPHN|nr:TonB-dependent receptor [Stakelama flava]MBW4332020.1 TonB-dependent receptor [Stakelama flava]
MNTRSKMLLVGASIAALSVATPGYAQQAPQTSAGSDDSQSADQTTDEQVSTDDIIVRGIRSSIESARNRKKDADVVQDSVSAEDIGALPDRSVTEAVQRIPGVSISHFQAGNDPDHFSVEGSGVVIRGLTYTRSELNGRDTFTANNGRGLSFADVPSELLAGVDVVKSASADMIEGGISGTVNLRTRVPFDAKGLLLAGTLEQNYGDFSKRSAPNISVLASDRFQTGIGEFGILGSFVRSQLRSRADGIQISNYGQRGLGADGSLLPGGDPDAVSTVYVPRGAGERSQTFNRVRYGYAGALQWRSNDGSMNLTMQFLRSDAREKTLEYTSEIATDSVASHGDSQAVPGSTLTFDDDGLFTSGALTSNTGYRDDQYNSRARTPLTGLKSSNISRYISRRLVTQDFGANFKWDINSRLDLMIDYQHVDSSVDNYDMSVRTASFQDVEIGMNGSKVPYVNFIPVQTCPTAAACPGVSFPPSYLLSPHDSYLDPYNSYYSAAMDHLEESDGNEDAAKVDLAYSIPSGWLNSIRVGYRYADRKNVARYSRYNYGSLSDVWGGGGPVWLDEGVNGDPSVAGGAPGPSEPHFFNNFFRGQANSPANEGRLFFPGSLLKDYASASAALLQIGDEWRARLVNGCPENWVPVAQRCGVVDGTSFLPGEINPVHETVNDAYVEARFGGEFANGWKLTGNAGVRYTSTRRVASGYMSFPQHTYTCPEPPAATSPFCELGADTLAAANAFANGALTPDRAKIHYDYFLPSLNMKLSVGHGLLFRFAFNKSIAPPDFGLTRDYYDVVLSTANEIIEANGAPEAVINVGNPYLKPVRANNYDLTAEYYFGKTGQLSLALFKKDLTGVVTNGTQRLSFTNNGVTFDGIVTTPVNSTETGHVKGAEFGYSQTYDFLPGILSGLGLSANFTYVDANGVQQSTLSVTDPDVAAGNVASVDTSKLPLEGLSKYTYNIQPFYQYGKLEMRAAYTWRSRYLLTTRDVIVPFAPIFAEPTGQLDASIFYDVTPRVRIGIQAVNLTDKQTRTTQVINDELLRAPRSWFVTDRRFTLSVRARFGS